ncbi:unnamed protein product [Ceutorhynchus assimilis]|uniref:PABS domain-containing protein n=1 Tax=Ceutorhynchus assimilis TaxID=467358 RepID=A0A9N9QPC7_9CUCU|nr:unnamed protein product [Ceutorhynchus assimilis]
MAVNTVLLDFSIDPSLAKNEASISILATNIENVLKDFLSELKLVNDFNFEGGLVKIYTANSGSLLSLRIFINGLITLNIDYFKEEKAEPLMNLDTCHQIEKVLKKRVSEIKRVQILPSLKRGDLIRYMPTSDERLLEYDIDKLVFEESTPFQKVQILHSKSMGNMLVLDDLQNIAESDLVYTETLMQRGKENYANKEIVILGGGDGALLYELLKEKPKQVIMLEIDEVVMKACAKHMRSICGDVLDQYERPNYKIIIGDCIKALEQYIKEGKKFDYVFGDLTDVPISENESQEVWAFINNIISLSFKILKPSGKFMTHLTGGSSPEAIEAYLQYLKKMNPPVKFTQDRAFVPSFLEEWVFCQVSFADPAAIQE